MSGQRLRTLARRLRADSTDTEQKLWRLLRAHRFQGFKFRRQQPIGPYIVDFICFETKLIIELDGSQHAERKQYDQSRDAWLMSEGFRVLRIWNNELLENEEGVLEKILSVLTLSPGPSPLKGEGRA
jgi:very-short-patch-repair endonuclease